MIKVKNNVTPPLLVIMAAVANVAERWGITVVVTSGTDGKHMQNSKHYEAAALDVRSKQPFKTPKEKLDFLAAVMERLGDNYYGLLEAPGNPNEHFHIEFDPPKRGN